MMRMWLPNDEDVEGWTEFWNEWADWLKEADLRVLLDIADGAIEEARKHS